MPDGVGKILFRRALPFPRGFKVTLRGIAQVSDFIGNRLAQIGHLIVQIDDSPRICAELARQIPLPHSQIQISQPGQRRIGRGIDRGGRVDRVCRSGVYRRGGRLIDPGQCFGGFLTHGGELGGHLSDLLVVQQAAGYTDDIVVPFEISDRTPGSFCLRRN